MAKNRYAVQHDGLTFKRSTDRTYTHAVLAPISLASELDDAARSAVWDWENNQDYYQELTTGQRRNAWGQVVPVEPAEVEKAKAWLALGLAGHIADSQAKRRERWVKEWGERPAAWACKGWCGRVDLAHKLAVPGDVVLEVAHA